VSSGSAPRFGFLAEAARSPIEDRRQVQTFVNITRPDCTSNELQPSAGFLHELTAKRWRIETHLASCGPFHPPRADSRSAIKSLGSSIPTERRNRSGGAGLSAPSTEARCSIRLSTPPSEVARFQISTRAAVAIAASAPPRTRILSMPPKPPVIWRAAIA